MGIKLVLYTNALSEHQMPLAREIVAKVGADNFRYIYTGKNGQKLQESRATDEWIVYGDSPWLEEADVILVGGIRPIELMEKRLKAGKITLYMSERWFKPIPILSAKWLVPGWIRMFVPSYWKMAKRFANLFRYDKYRFFPIGPWSKKDMGLICKVFGVKMLEEKIVDWGYFVAPSEQQSKKLEVRGKSEGRLRVLWVGRMLKLKRVDTIILAVREIVKESLRRRSGNAQTTSSCTSPLASSSLHSKNICSHIALVELTLVGDGPERKRLEKMAEGLPVKFLPSQPIAKIREIMREHDVYVFSSNGMDGWGAVVSEAVEEGMKVLGTYETGAAATILPESNLFHCGDYKTLARKLMSEIKFVSIGQWSAEEGAKKLLAINL